jgi:transposase InsO family protein
VKLEQADVNRICKRVVDYSVDTTIVAEQFGISRRRVQQLAKQYRETGEIPELETPGRKPYADHPEDLDECVLELYHTLDIGAVAIAHILRTRDGLSIANNRVHAILQEHDHVTENPNKQGRRRPWVRFERDYSLVTAHLDWFHNSREEWVLAIEDDASRFVYDLIETDAASAERTVDLLDEVRQTYETNVPILEVITDHGSEFVNTHQDDRPDRDHAFEGYLHENDIEHTLCKVGRPQSNGKLERFYQTYEKQRWRFDSIQEFLHFYNEVRPHMSLLWDELETPAAAFDRLLPSPEQDFDGLLQNGGETA